MNFECSVTCDEARSARWRVVELMSRYGSDRALGVTYDEDEGVSVLPDGGYASSCGDCARYIRSREPNTAIYGFWSNDNPRWAGAQLVDGHDFAVVDERYIVDPWIVETEALSRQSVFDLDDPSDQTVVKWIYGGRTKWRLVAPASLLRTAIQSPAVRSPSYQ